MPTQLSDVVVPTFYDQYGGINTMASTALYQGGVLVDGPILYAQLAVGRDIVNLPAWLDLAARIDPGGVEPNLLSDNPARLATPKKVTAVNHPVRKSVFIDPALLCCNGEGEETTADPSLRSG